LNVILLHKLDFTPPSELKQVETLLDNLEFKLGQFKQLFPKKEPKRGLMNLGGSVLRALFGTATMTDLHRLHEAMDDLQDKNFEVAHSLSKQVTIIRNLNSVASLNTEALVNLSTLVKDNIVQSHSKFLDTSKDIAWLNDTLRHQSELYIHIRQLEYSLMLAVQQIGELFSSVQYALLGKLPVSLVPPATLHSILTNISLNLPENYELVAGTKFQDVHTYYELVKVALVGNAHSVQLVLSVPLKTAAQMFTLFKILVFPMRLSPDSFLKYQLDYRYFGLAVDQRDYALLTEADLQLCTTGSVTICPATVPLYHSQVLTCEGSLYFQSSSSYQLCRKNLIRHYQTPTLIHHGAKWVYNFPEPSQVTIRCPQENGWFSRTVSLEGSGLIHNASACHIASQEIRTLPVLSRTAEHPLDAPPVFLPDNFPAVASHEVAKIEAAMFPETAGLDYVKERLVTPRQTFDVDTLLHVHQKSVHTSQETHWLRLATMTAGATTILLLLFLLFRTYARTLFSRCRLIKADPSPVAAPRVTPIPVADCEHVGTETRTLGLQEPVKFTTYALPNAHAEGRHDVSTTWSHAR
jgi:hypothetical protein